MTQQELDSLKVALDHLDAGELDLAHKTAQLLEGVPIADAVHAIVHRREGDFSNSAYWWRRVGDDLPESLRALYGGDPVAFVERCKQALPGSAAAKDIPVVEKREVAAIRALLPERIG